MNPQSVGDWHDFFVMAGAATAALSGLVFVGMSLHVRAISEHAEYRYRARITLGALIFILIGTGLGLIPRQDGSELGVELVVATAVFGPTGSFWAVHSSFSSAHQRVAFLSPDGPTVAFTFRFTVLLFT